MLLRQYVSRVKQMLDGYGALPPYTTGVLLMMTGYDEASCAEMAEVGARVRALGVDCFPGFRLFSGGTTPDSVTPQAFVDHAAGLERAFQARPNKLDFRFGFDCEAYGDGPASSEMIPARLEQLGLTDDTYRAAMSPLLTAVRRRRVVPAVHPGNILDRTVHNLLSARALNGIGEVWDETVFGLPLTWARRGAAAMQADLALASRLQIEWLAAFPRAVVRFGLFDDVSRAWADTFRAQLLANFQHAPWVFDADREPASVAARPGAAWIDGTALSPLNDAADVWVAPYFSLGSGASLTNTGRVCGIWRFTVDPPAIVVASDPNHVRSEGGWTMGPLTNGHYYSFRITSGLPLDSTPWTLLLDVTLPTAEHDNNPICNAKYFNGNGWAVRWRSDNGGEVYLDDTVSTFVVASGVSLGSTVRILVGRNGTTWTHGASTSTGQNLVPREHVQIGVEGHANEPRHTAWPGLKWPTERAPITVWRRALSPQERSEALAAARGYPYGR